MIVSIDIPCAVSLLLFLLLLQPFGSLASLLLHVVFSQHLHVDVSNKHYV